MIVGSLGPRLASANHRLVATIGLPNRTVITHTDYNRLVAKPKKGRWESAFSFLGIILWHLSATSSV